MIRMPPPPPFLLHERILFSVLVITSVRSMLSSWTLSTITWLLLAVLTGASLWWNAKLAKSSLSPGRHYGLMAITLVVYASLGQGVEAIYSESLSKTSEKLDKWLHQIDVEVFGAALFELIRHQIMPDFAKYLCDELFSLSYIALIPLEIWALWVLSRKPVFLKHFSVGLFTVLALGYFGYTLVPAKGPCAVKFISDCMAPVEDFRWISNLRYTLVHYISIKYDVFPSLHVAVPMYMLGFAILYTPQKTFLLATFSLFLLIFSISAIYLGYHYLVDTAFGVLLGGIGLCAIKAQSFLESRAGTT